MIVPGNATVNSPDFNCIALETSSDGNPSVPPYTLEEVLYYHSKKLFRSERCPVDDHGHIIPGNPECLIDKSQNKF